jgi:hypothetical protein
LRYFLMVQWASMNRQFGTYNRQCKMQGK